MPKASPPKPKIPPGLEKKLEKWRLGIKTLDRRSPEAGAWFTEGRGLIDELIRTLESQGAVRKIPDTGRPEKNVLSPRESASHQIFSLIVQLETEGATVKNLIDPQYAKKIREAITAIDSAIDKVRDIGFPTDGLAIEREHLVEYLREHPPKRAHPESHFRDFHLACLIVPLGQAGFSQSEIVYFLRGVLGGIGGPVATLFADTGDSRNLLGDTLGRVVKDVFSGRIVFPLSKHRTKVNGIISARKQKK